MGFRGIYVVLFLLFSRFLMVASSSFLLWAFMVLRRFSWRSLDFINDKRPLVIFGALPIALLKAAEL